MATYRTPDVYVKEESLLPPSAASVATAVPAFIGYTETGYSTDPADGLPVAKRISSMLEYKNAFGGPSPANLEVVTSGSDPDYTVLDVVPVSQEYNFTLYHDLEMYFKNGGGPCYIISVGDYTNGMELGHFENGLNALKKEDEPTLILFPEAAQLDLANYGSLCAEALSQCEDLMDRFTIMDVPDSASADDWRGAVSATSSLKYGAAYTPSLVTTITPSYDEAQVRVTGIGSNTEARFDVFPNNSTNGLKIQYQDKTGEGDPVDRPQVRLMAKEQDGTAGISVNMADGVLTVYGLAAPAEGATDNRTATNVKTAFDTWATAASNTEWTAVVQGTGNDIIQATGNKTHLLTVNPDGTVYTMNDIKDSHTAVYNAAKAALQKQRLTLTSSASMAGVYARVDSQRGVWKAPANVGVNGVVAPTKKITNAEQDSLNVDAGSGKSINAIRSFAGKGTLVWGARTLAGNDNEWRYIPVRRLFILVEESLKKSTGFAVFEPNTPTTWLKVRGLIDSYLYGLWQQGALAGASQDQAYFINVGLGSTMTEQDILEGRMIVEIGLAAVRPAEFIILKFSHKLQES